MSNRDHTGAEGDAYGTFSWQYDALGNRIQQVYGDTTIAYAYGSGNNRLVSEAFGDTVNSYSYDDAGSMSRMDYYYDETLLGGSTYSNNDDSRLTSVAQSGVVESNYYDHLGQRVLKDDNGEHKVFVYDIFGNLIGEYIPGSDAVREWVYLGGHRIAMLHANMPDVGINPPECGGLPSPPGGCSRMIPSEGEQSSAPFNWVLIGLCPTVAWGGYKYRKRKRVLVCIVLGATGIMTFMLTRKAKPQTYPEEAVYYYHNDHLGTPKVLTDSDGDVVWEAVMEPFGSISQVLTSQVSNPFRFPGQYEDEWTGMYYNHHRYYVAGLGRYNRSDPFHIWPLFRLQDASRYGNAYNYASDMPINSMDSTGLRTCDSGKCRDCEGGKWHSTGNLYHSISAGGSILAVLGLGGSGSIVDLYCSSDAKLEVSMATVCGKTGLSTGGWASIAAGRMDCSGAYCIEDLKGYNIGMSGGAGVGPYGGGAGGGTGFHAACGSVEVGVGAGWYVTFPLLDLCHSWVY